MYIGHDNHEYEDAEMDNMRRDAQESTIAENYQALSALVGWIVEAMEFVPLPDEAKAALDVLLSTQAELKEMLHAND